ncbi:cation:proton antiporter [Rufibacter latericius]|uniref:Sodium:proton antiporter n=1 Tax=Rufibacter latericius TaxID=2487040 RepID=A0A3M9N1Q3_9BACT|nr:sodium:proton antiporter [Rufibacter latericius]RNI31083.1 sodium:proton antiporter [Rufibacter latericius]
MTSGIIITLCTLLLVAYLFDLTSAKTKVPSVILLLAMGWVVRQGSGFFEVQVPNLSPLLPILGTVGLILIVLEGSLELEIDRTKFPLVKKTFIVALFPMLALAFLLAFLFQYSGQPSFKDNLLNALPLCVISSAIAIPSVKNFSGFNKEFVIYESSLSDIFGVLLFNFVALNETINTQSFAHFGLELLVIVAVSFIATLGLSFLIGRIDHHVKFGPIILLVILIYAVSKVYHLPALIFILLFGLFLGNLDELKHLKWVQKLRPTELNREVHRFKEITVEATFLIRALFFLLFGFLIETSDLLNISTFAWAVGIVAAIFGLRGLQLWVAKLPMKPLLFVAPRGLITILLFFSIPLGNRIPLVDNSLIIQVIILTVLVMMVGSVFFKQDHNEEAKSSMEGLS